MKIHPKQLISTNRLDVFTKTSYARSIQMKQNLNWPKIVYNEYLKKIEPKSGFSEDNLKYSLVDYETSFLSLFESICSEGFNENVSTIPMGKTGITNGAHRLAICLALNLQPYISESVEADHIYDYRFMRSIGYDPEFLEYTILEYLRYSQNVKVLCLMNIQPSITQEILKEIHETSKVLFSKRVELTKIGGRRIIEVLYAQNEWWRGELLENLYLERFSDMDSSITCIFIDEEEIAKVIETKNRIRLKYAKHLYAKKIHSTDNFKETRLLGEAILSKSSLHFLNNSPIGSETRLLTIIDEFFTSNPDLRKEEIVFDSSAILEMYGLRQASDLDFISIDEKFIGNKNKKLVECHNSEYVKFPIAIPELIYSPISYFYCHGFKFLDLHLVNLFKSLRGEVKDRDDIQLIHNLQNRSAIYATPKSQGIAIKHRRKLLIRAFVDVILGYFPNSFSGKFRALYKFFRSIVHRVFNLKKNYL
jgi:hypothetical protein